MLEKEINDLNILIKDLSLLIPITKESKLMTLEISNKISDTLDKIVSNFYSILTKHFKTGINFWNFISKHVNKPVTKFCIMNENNSSNEDENDFNIYEKKAKNWILISILENSLYNSIKEISHFQESANNNLIENTLFINILKDLDKFDFTKVFNEDYEKYLAYLDKNKDESFHGLFNLSPVWEENKRREHNEEEFSKENEMDSIYQEYDLNLINIKTEVLLDLSYKDSELDLIDLNINNKKSKNYEKSKFNNNNISKPEEFDFKKKADIIPSIVDNFYNFIPKIKSGPVIDEPNHNSNIIINSINEDEFYINNHIRKNSGLKLYTEETFKHLPSDEFYTSKESNENNHQIKIKNTQILYKNEFYKKASFFKFNTDTLNEKSTSLKEQNYQCYICLKKFSHFFEIPFESIFWCSYYMRFVCKDCIAKEYSIIPQFILKEWCFDKFSISKKALDLIKYWYDKPIICFKKNKKEEIINKIPKKILVIKKSINKIFNYMKCDNVFDFIETKIPQYKYLLLKEKIFSLKDLISMHNSNKFFQTLQNIKDILISHIKFECEKCKYDGEICPICQKEEKIYFYDIENVIYCKTCSKYHHKECYYIEHHIN